MISMPLLPKEDGAMRFPVKSRYHFPVMLLYNVQTCCMCPYKLAVGKCSSSKDGSYVDVYRWAELQFC